jgi:hypothetical protein
MVMDRDKFRMSFQEKSEKHYTSGSDENRGPKCLICQKETVDLRSCMSFQAKVKEAFGSEKWMKERSKGLVSSRKTVKVVLKKKQGFVFSVFD